MKTRTLAALSAVLLAPALACQAQTYTVLHAFKGGKDGASPLPGSGAGFVADSSGNLYGVSAGQDVPSDFGTVFELSPPGSGSAWTETVLYRFKGGTDADFPGATLLPDGSGGFFSTSFAGGTGTCAPLGTPIGCGTAFHVIPPSKPGAKWKESVLYRFSGGADGASPTGGFVSDTNGSLYSATVSGGTGTCNGGAGCGVIFRLDPPANGSKKWAETAIYAFTGGADGASPAAGLTIDAAGNLYGEAGSGGLANCGYGSGCGVIFELSPPAKGQTVWTNKVLYTFTNGADGAFPQGPPIFGPNGVLLGTAANGGSANCSGGCGTMYELTPPKKGQTSWRFSVLATLQGPPNDGVYLNAALTPDGTGNYVTTTFYGGTGTCAFTNAPAGCGTVLRLTPPAKKSGSWTENLLYSFPALKDGAVAGSPVIVNSAGVIYGATFSGGDLRVCGGGGCGVAFSLAP